MLGKADLADGAYYRGVSANGTIARWNEREGCFYYWRFRTGTWRLETLRHPEDFIASNTFAPEKKIPAPKKEIPFTEDEWG